MIILKQSTASQSVLIGPFIDDTDGKTAETALTINNTDIRLSKGGTNIVSKNSGGGTHDELGYYAITFDATDTNTVGPLQLSSQVTGALPVYHEFMVVEEAIYDALFGTGANAFDASGRVDVGAVLGTAQSAGDLYEDTRKIGYVGKFGLGIYIDAGAANTNTVFGVDGTIDNPVSTLTAAKTLADGAGLKTYYILNQSSLTLAATHVDWTFASLDEPSANTIDLGSQDVSRSRFYSISVQGTQAGTGRIYAENCVLKDPGAGITTLHIWAKDCGILDDITLDASNDNVLIDCFSLVAGNGAPIIRMSGASGTLKIERFGGGVDLRDTTASHTVTISQVGQVIFDVSCNVNTAITLRGVGSKTDNTAGMVNLTEEAYLNNTTIADSILKRDWTLVTGEASRSVLNALRFLRNKWSITGSTLTVTEEDDTTSAWTGTLTTNAAADPITGNDPT